MTARRAGVGLALLTLTLSGCGLLSTPLPDVTSTLATDAVTELEEAGFAVELDGADPEAEDLSLWQVTSQNPAEKAATRGATVTLEVETVLSAAARRCATGGLGDGGRSLSLDMQGEDFGSGDLPFEKVMCALEELGVTDAVRDKMGSTTSMDGRVEDSWAGLDASWKYHPDNGLDVVVELGD